LRAKYLGQDLASRIDQLKPASKPAQSTSVASEAELWTSLTCAACDAVTRVTTREVSAENAISCRSCWQPLTLLDSADGDTLHDTDTVLDVKKLAAQKRARRQLQLAHAKQHESADESVDADTVESNSDAGIDSLDDGIETVVLAKIQIEIEDEEDSSKGWTSLKKNLERRRDDFAGAIVSVVVHMLLWVMLAAIVMKFDAPWGDTSFNLSISEDATVLESSAIEQAQLGEDQSDEPFVPIQNVRVDHLLAGGAAGGAAAGGTAEFVMPSTDEFRFGGGEAKWSVELGSGFEGRSPKNRAELAAKSGGTPESEDSVESGLKWLARSQREDGSWDYSASKKIVLGRARGGGKTEPMSATAMAVMCFLGAGYTHQEDKYQDEVKKAMEYLTSKQKRTGDARGNGDMYSQGLVSIALCEAYGMTRDPELREPAQSALDFIEKAQHPSGGWRYMPKQAGDTSVVGWQVMAIASGRMAGLETSRVVTGRAVKFLDIVFSKKAGTYGYTSRSLANYGANTAIGTLCRMYLHFGFDKAAMQKSVAATAKYDPTGQDLYGRYYALQVLHHVGGPIWEKWNPKCRDHLVKLQTRAGDNRGSWAPSSKWSTRGGGRLYETCLSIMCLEVYYRHMPIYQKVDFQ
jgi:hypothetical protein